MDSKGLAPFIKLLEKKPNLGDHVQHLTFTENAAAVTFKSLNFSEKQQFDPKGARGGAGSLDSELDTDTMGLFLEHSLLHAEDLVKLKSFSSLATSILGKNKDVNKYQRSYSMLCVARSFILNRCRNLKSFNVEESNVFFPFCYRLGKEAKPFECFVNSLKSINIRKWLYGSPIIYLTNAVWLLKLPNLTDASIYAFLNAHDVDFIEEHHQVFSLDPSQIKRLDLELYHGPPRDSTGSEYILAREVLSTVVQQFLSLTKDLESLTLRFDEPKKELNIDISLLQGLRNSYQTLHTLKMQMIEYPEFADKIKEKINPLCRFFNLRTLFGNARLLCGLEYIVWDFDHNEGIKYEFLPPSIQEFGLTFNSRAADRNVEDPMVRLEPEEALARTIKRIASSSSIKKIFSSKHASDRQGRFSFSFQTS